MAFVLVMKFGGTSVGSASRFGQVLQIVKGEWEKGNKSVVVLSAMSEVTNNLISCAQLALKQDLRKALEMLAQIKSRHFFLLAELFSEPAIIESLKKELNPIFDQVEVLLKGIAYLQELTKRSQDAISGFGELLSTIIFARYAQEQGLPTKWLDARQFITTDDNFGRANPDWDDLVPKAKDTLLPILANNICPITQGFIGATKDGIATTLGRGGSDLTASIIGVALDASEIQIWTDVDGMMTADPRLVPEATVLSEVSFQEASELAYFGAKVLHPLTIKPAIEKKIPVRILNTVKPELRGTLIKEANGSTKTSQLRACSIAAKKGLTAVFIHSPKMLMTHGFLAQVFEIFARYETSIDLIATSEVSVSLTIDSVDQLAAINEALAVLGEVSVMHDVAIVTIVGSQFRHQCGVAGQVFSALKDINIIMISGGASDINLSCVVSQKDADKAVKQLHQEFFAALMPV
jgi:aspartate kinase